MQNPHPMTLYKTVPVTEDNLPKIKTRLPFIGLYSGDILYDTVIPGVDFSEYSRRYSHYLLPVGEEKLRRLCEGCYKEGYDRGWWNSGLKDYSNNPSGLYPAITSLIDKFLKDEL